VRTPDEIELLMWRPLTGVEAGLVAYWNLDEGSGTIAQESTHSGLSASLVNGTCWATDTAPLRILSFTRMESVGPQRWVFQFLDAGTGSTNHVLQYLPELSSPRVWTDLSLVDVSPLGEGVFQAEAAELSAQQGFFRVHGLRSVQVNLSSTISGLREGSGTNWLTLLFDSPFVGDVRYVLGGPDTNSVGGVTGSVFVHGTRAHIPIVVQDDTDLGALKYITLTLEEGEGYHIGNSGRQTLSLEDNDAEWQGSLFLPTGLSAQATSLVNGVEVRVPLSTQATIDFVLTIQRSGGSSSAALRSDEYGFFPVDPVPGQIELTESRFALSVPGIAVEAGSTLLDAPLNLRLDLSAENGAPAQLVSETLLQGRATLVQEVVGRSHLNTTSAGTFELRKPGMRPSAHQVELVP
jgi:hypothetical protein